jgi:hypothetical protein
MRRWVADTVNCIYIDEICVFDDTIYRKIINVCVIAHHLYKEPLYIYDQRISVHSLVICFVGSHMNFSN